jgi:hypothetical protein
MAPPSALNALTKDAGVGPLRRDAVLWCTRMQYEFDAHLNPKLTVNLPSLGPPHVWNLDAVQLAGAGALACDATVLVPFQEYKIIDPAILEIARALARQAAREDHEREAIH